MIVSVLEKAGYVVVTETNGNRALRRYSKEGPFDLVLTEIEHKGMNGVELIHAIHKKNRKQDVRIVTGWPILLKSLPSQTAVIRCLAPPLHAVKRQIRGNCFPPGRRLRT